MLQLAIPQSAPEKTLGSSGDATGNPEEGDQVSADPGPVLSESAPSRRLRIELVNAKSWLAGKNATLQISVKEENGDPVSDAEVVVQIEGSSPNQTYGSRSGVYGQAQIDFEMPKITSLDAAMIIRAEEGAGSGQLRFALRAKPKVSSIA